MKNLPSSLHWLSMAALCLTTTTELHADGTLLLTTSTHDEPQIQILGDDDQDWALEYSTDLQTWTALNSWGTLLSSSTATLAPTRSPGAFNSGQVFFRAQRTHGLFDPGLLRTVHLTFSNANYTSLLTTARSTGGNVPAQLTLANGLHLPYVGARYKGNTSFTMGGTKKSINLDINLYDPEARAMGYRAINLNNSAGDETIMREPLYFGVMRTYAPAPRGALARVYINNEDWGVYSMVDQINNDLLDEWFPSHDGDSWRAPNVGGGTGGTRPGGGGFASAGSAFAYLGNTNITTYQNNYELKSDNSTNAWQRLVHAIHILNNTSDSELRDQVEDVFAVDRWLWFLGIEIALTDDDSYWNKGADYAFYYEPESGRIHPVQHDGNEAFIPGDVQLSPVVGSTGTNRPLLYKLLPIPELRQRYLAHLRTVLKESMHPDRLTPVIQAYRDLSLAAITADPKKNFTMSAYQSELVNLKTFITNRYKFLTNHSELTPRQPSITAVHDPDPLPKPGETPWITAEVHPTNNEGIDSVWLYWRDKTYGKFSRTQMFDDGAHGDGAAGDNTFGGATGAFPAGKKIHYYIEARSANSAKAAIFSPERAEQDTHSYRVGLTTAHNSPIVIHEIMASTSTTIRDPQGDAEDWIELWNLSNQAVDLTGRYLSDDSTKPRKWKFPDGTTITPNGYLVVWADEKGTDSPGLHASFKLSASGEQVYLLDTDANLNAVLDAVAFGPQNTDRSYGRNPQSLSEWIELTPTPGMANSTP